MESHAIVRPSRFAVTEIVAFRRKQSFGRRFPDFKHLYCVDLQISARHGYLARVSDTHARGRCIDRQVLPSLTLNSFCGVGSFGSPDAEKEDVPLRCDHAGGQNPEIGAIGLSSTLWLE